MNGFTSALGMTAMKIQTALLAIPHYVVHDDGTYEVIEDAIQTFSNEPISRYVDLPARYQYTIPWDIDILYEGVDMLTGMLRNAIPVAFWIFLLLTGVHLVFNFIRSLSS